MCNRNYIVKVHGHMIVQVVSVVACWYTIPLLYGINFRARHRSAGVHNLSGLNVCAEIEEKPARVGEYVTHSEKRDHLG